MTGLVDLTPHLVQISASNSDFYLILFLTFSYVYVCLKCFKIIVNPSTPLANPSGDDTFPNSACTNFRTKSSQRKHDRVAKALSDLLLKYNDTIILFTKRSEKDHACLIYSFRTKFDKTYLSIGKLRYFAQING